MDRTDFDDLIAEGVESDVSQRLLLVLLSIEVAEQRGPDEASGTLTPVMANDLELAPEISFEALVAEADSVGQPWDMVMVSTLTDQGGRMPERDLATPHLEKMADDVVQGRDLSAYAIFDRSGNRLALNPESTG
ncbi:MAG: hypothetical protein LAT81_11420 [Oceanicaulis sp.]|nr:hypothetical protein [Salinarimonas sp.]MCH8490522.1 hypothetical protein [Oceanicaulis sp.]